MCANGTVISEWSYVPLDHEDPPVFISTWLEKVDDPGWKTYMKANKNIPFYAAIVYLLLIFGLKGFMKTRPAFELRKPLVVWNWTLAIFSMIGFYRMGQELGHNRFNATTVINYFVHSIVYPYFALRAMKIRVPRRLAMALTSLQLVQMLIGMLVNIYSIYVVSVQQEFCARDSYTIKWSIGVYSSFVILFADFLINRYFPKNKSKRL
ncbi:putative fatty acid elongation protein 3, partial [Orchesella cincta]